MRAGQARVVGRGVAGTVAAALGGMKLVLGFVLATMLAACGGKANPPVTANEATPTTAAEAPPASSDDCMKTCVADGGPKDASGAPLEPAGTAPEDLERPCQESCGMLEPSPAALDGYDDTP